ncbi:MAG TPA: hypothetical protein VNA17_12085 [Pyrinomonadaceae bacterium]|nr:hypothetical protein [Pyrinomonadaceae bacterium]
MNGGCNSDLFQPQESAPLALSTVPAVRLNYRFEPDVPPPTAGSPSNTTQTIDAAVQADFDATRPFELLERTIPSPDKKRILAVYRHIADVQAEYRLDMYSADGRPERKLTSDAMAVHFPDTIVWSPDSGSLAFVAMIRALQVPGASPTPTPPPSLPTPTPEATPVRDEGVAVDSPTPAPGPTLAAPTGILTFRTEQIYIANADGSSIKPVTENEGIIYFYYAWSPDSTMLVALASTAREWRYLEVLAATKGEMMAPQGRPRIIERNGRERRLDDNQTAVRPVWSPDSTKVAAAFENQVRVYDAVGTSPTQAAIPLRNQLLISSQAYDRQQQRSLQTSDQNSNALPETAATPDEPLSTLPDEKMLVSYNPIVEIAWTSDDMLYLQTAYLKRMRNEADSVRSFSRWHRLILTPQRIPAGNSKP